jgi:undecaprenyl-phosphate 4-deoxy-4-formamido-L-arabinose transferase
LFTLFAILFVFLGLLIFAVGLVGEYVGRIYAEVRRRPSYVVRAVHGARPKGAPWITRPKRRAVDNASQKARRG